MTTFRSLPDLLTSFTPFDELEALHVQQTQEFLSKIDNAYDRSNLLGHVVADAWIVNPERDQVVLVEHLLNQHWVSPGGHCDGNADVFAGALREAEEETGLTNLTPLLDGNIFDVNTGVVPTRKKEGRIEPAHLHFDICFAFEVPTGAPLVISEESTKLEWVPVKDISKLHTHEGHYRRPLKTNVGLK